MKSIKLRRVGKGRHTASVNWQGWIVAKILKLAHTHFEIVGLFFFKLQPCRETYCLLGSVQAALGYLLEVPELASVQ